MKAGAVRSIEYEKLAQVEHDMWWFRGLHENLIIAFSQRRQKPPRGIVLDVGCGTGGFLHKIGRSLPEYTVLGLELDKTACKIATGRGQLVCLGSATCLPFSDGCLAAIFSADMLNHAGVDEQQAIQNFYRCLHSEGILVLNLPAYPWLLSGHDHAVHNASLYLQTYSSVAKAGRVCRYQNHSLEYGPVSIDGYASALSQISG